MPLNIVTLEHSPEAAVLTQPCAEVSFPLSKEDVILIAQMKQKLSDINGVGLAAPQIGVAKQIIIYAISEDAKALRVVAEQIVPPTVLINPRYEPSPDAKIFHDWEACFSVTEHTGKVPRYDGITYYAQSLTGDKIEGVATGFTARVLQHEIDHVHGKLILDRLTPDCVQGHPDEMLLLRFKDFSPERRAVAKKIFLQRLKTIAPHDITQRQSIEKALKVLEND